jgi:DnaK suppressor protein
MTLSVTLLTPQQIGEIRDALERTLRKLERSIRSRGNGGAVDLDQSSVGRLSRIEALQNQGLNDNLRERERTRLDEVLQALDRLEAGTYGLCARCRLQIAYERLVVFPETRTCAGCPAGH